MHHDRELGGDALDQLAGQQRGDEDAREERRCRAPPHASGRTPQRSSPPGTCWSCRGDRRAWSGWRASPCCPDRAAPPRRRTTCASPVAPADPRVARRASRSAHRRRRSRGCSATLAGCLSQPTRAASQNSLPRPTSAPSQLAARGEVHQPEGDDRSPDGQAERPQVAQCALSVSSSARRPGRSRGCARRCRSAWGGRSSAPCPGPARATGPAIPAYGRWRRAP